MSSIAPTGWESIIHSFTPHFAESHLCPTPGSLGPCSCVQAQVAEELSEAGKPVCAWCSSPERGAKRFATDQNLERHFNGIHIQEEKFVCSGCGKWFKSDDLSSRCQRSHREDFVCYFEGCSKRGPYKRLDMLKSHAKTEHHVSEVETHRAIRPKPDSSSSQGIRVARFPEPPELIRLRTDSEILRQNLVRLMYLDQSRQALDLMPVDHEALRRKNAEERAPKSLRPNLPSLNPASTWFMGSTEPSAFGHNGTEYFPPGAGGPGATFSLDPYGYAFPNAYN